MGIIDILELKGSGMYVIISMVFMAALMMMPFAAGQPILISIIRSDVCEKSITCLPISSLIPLDNSDQKISGKLTDAGREKPIYRNHYQFYQFKKVSYIVCVECSSVFQDHSRKITIEANTNFTYVKQEDHTIRNNTFYDYSKRHIDNCRTATVASDLELLKDTIYVMGHDCKVPSKFTEQKKTVKPYAKIKYCGNECQHQKFMKDAKEKSKKAFLVQPDKILKNQNGKVKVNG